MAVLRSSQADDIVPVADTTSNQFDRDVLGQKTDAAVTTVGVTKSVMAYVKGILNTVITAGAAQTEVQIYGPAAVDVDNTGHIEACIVDKDVGLVVSTAITAGTYNLVRVRAGVSTTIATGSAFSKSNGRVYADITFATASWGLDDAFQVVPQGDTTYIVNSVTFYPAIPTISGIISDMATIEGKIDVIDGFMDIPSTDAVTNSQMRDVLGSKADTSIPIYATSTGSAMAYLKGIVSAGAKEANMSVPTADVATNVRMRDVIGNKTDAAVLTPSTGGSITAYLKGLLSLTTAGKRQVKVVAITAAANAAPVTLATVTTQSCVIKSIIIRAAAATTADLTSVNVKGGTASAVTFIDDVTGIRANIAAQDQQIAWDGSVAIPATGTITFDPTGTGATALNMVATIEYFSTVDGGYLA